MSLPTWYKRRIIVASSPQEHEAIIYVQRVLRCKETGELDEETKSHVRGFQTLFDLRPTGIIDDATAIQINNVWPEGA
jgi:Putative peptidoglycan binding domain